MKVNMKSESDMKLCPSARVTLKGWWVDKLAPNKFSPLKKTHFTTSANFLRISVESSGHHVPFCKGSKTNLMNILVQFWRSRRNKCFGLNERARNVRFMQIPNQLMVRRISQDFHSLPQHQMVLLTFLVLPFLGEIYNLQKVKGALNRYHTF